MITAASLVSEVLGWMELDGNTADNAASFQVYTNLSNIQRYIIRNLPLKEIDVGIKTVQFNLTISINRIQWPSDFARFLVLWLSYSAAITESAPGRRVREDKEGAIESDIADFQPSTDYPQYDLVENGFRFAPVPTATQANGGQIKYIQQLPAISTSQDSLLRDDHKALMVYGAAELCASVDDYNLSLAAKMGELFNRELQGFWGDNRIDIKPRRRIK